MADRKSKACDVLVEAVRSDLDELVELSRKTGKEAFLGACYRPRTDGVKFRARCTGTECSVRSEEYDCAKGEQRMLIHSHPYADIGAPSFPDLVVGAKLYARYACVLSTTEHPELYCVEGLDHEDVDQLKDEEHDLVMEYRDYFKQGLEPVPSRADTTLNYIMFQKAMTLHPELKYCKRRL